VSTLFLERRILAAMAAALAPGGLLLVETFGADHPRVSGREFPAHLLLEPNELLRAFGDLRVLRYRDADLGDRAVVGLVARRP
jgi:hypothetical protein